MKTVFYPRLTHVQQFRDCSLHFYFHRRENLLSLLLSDDILIFTKNYIHYPLQYYILYFIIKLYIVSEIEKGTFCSLKKY